ncbi:hypothetical protein sS8_0273 [Methylocaldum marinum]|uniref:Uncharacterized protein n=1 Tax=Methylocaldum marinum TaxID=1432792 RepID=A0A286P3L9_9GAMM|nr:hypothetical protein sS8_0273 [Methylocaldum marinum]
MDSASFRANPKHLGKSGSYRSPETAIEPIVRRVVVKFPFRGGPHLSESGKLLYRRSFCNVPSPPLRAPPSPKCKLSLTPPQSRLKRNAAIRLKAIPEHFL